MPTRLPDGLVIGALLPREDPRDALFAHTDALNGPTTLASLKPGGVVGTSSLRRQAQLLALRPDLRIVPIRGNVDTRRSEEHTSELQSLMRISYAVFCLK